MSWFKQGLSTLGEGLTSLTKEILSEDQTIVDPEGSTGPYLPPDSVSQYPDFTDQETKINRLEALILELERRASNAENSLAANSNQYQQLLENHENQMVAMRDQVHDLRRELDEARQGAPRPEGPHMYSPDVQESQDYFDIDLNASSPIPQKTENFPVFSSSSSTAILARVHSSDHETQTRPHSVEDTEGSDVLELELAEKDNTIRHLTQELSRFKSTVAYLEAQITEKPETVDAGIQVPLVGQVDVFAQTDDYECSPSASDVNSNDSPSDVSSFCSISLSVNDENVQTEPLDSTLHPDQILDEIDKPEIAVQTEPILRSYQLLDEVERREISTQTEPEESANEFTAEKTEIVVEAELSDAIMQTDDVDKLETSTQVEHENAMEIHPVITAEMAAQTLFEKAQTSDQNSQWENPTHFATVSTCTTATEVQEEISQTDDIAFAVIFENCAAETQTSEVPMFSVALQVNAEGVDVECQSESSGDIIAHGDYSRLVQEGQALQFDIADLTNANGRLRKEVDRLRAHLMEVEQVYADDMQTVQVREEELRKIIQTLEEQLASADASQQHISSEVSEQVAGLHEQVEILSQARDEAVLKLHEAEKRNQQLETSLSNIRMAIEHIKLEHRAGIEQDREKAKKSTHKLEEQIQSLMAENAVLLQRVTTVEKDRAENMSLLADLELARRQVQNLTNDIEKKEQFLAKALDDAASVGTRKVDKALLKSMLLGFFTGPKSCQSDILRMLMATLDFEEQDRQRINASQSSGLRTLFASGSKPLPSATEDSFSNLLVKFIEEESKPKQNVPPSPSATGAPRPGSTNLHDPVYPNPPARRTTPVGASSFFVASSESSERQDDVLRKILDDAPSAALKAAGSVDTV